MIHSLSVQLEEFCSFSTKEYFVVDPSWNNHPSMAEKA
jgi:hypothetical protein